MAESSWPSPNHNSRAVSDYEYETLVGPYSADGLIGTPADTPLVYADSTGRQVKVRAGRYAQVRGRQWYSGTSDLIVGLGANTSGSTRTDLIVLRLDRSTWDVTVKVVAGTPGAGAPAPTQNTGSSSIYEYPIARVPVISGYTTVAPTDVTNVGKLVGDWNRPWGVIGGQDYAPTGAVIGYSEGYGGSHIAGGAVPFHWPVVSPSISSGAVTTITGRRYRVSAVVVFLIQALAGNGPGLSASPNNITNAFDVFAINDGVADLAGQCIGPSGQDVRNGGWGGGLQRATLIAEYDETAGAAKTFSLTAYPWWPGYNHRISLMRGATANDRVFVEVEDLGPSSRLTPIA